MSVLDLNVVRGVLLVMLVVAFLGMWAWAWSSRRSAEFSSASRLPLEEDLGALPSGQGTDESTRTSNHAPTEA